MKLVEASAGSTGTLLFTVATIKCPLATLGFSLITGFDLDQAWPHDLFKPSKLSPEAQTKSRKEPAPKGQGGIGLDAVKVKRHI